MFYFFFGSWCLRTCDSQNVDIHICNLLIGTLAKSSSGNSLPISGHVPFSGNVDESLDRSTCKRRVMRRSSRPKQILASGCQVDAGELPDPSPTDDGNLIRPECRDTIGRISPFVNQDESWLGSFGDSLPTRPWVCITRMLVQYRHYVCYRYKRECTRIIQSGRSGLYFSLHLSNVLVKENLQMHSHLSKYLDQTRLSHSYHAGSASLYFFEDMETHNGITRMTFLATSLSGCFVRVEQARCCILVYNST